MGESGRPPNPQLLFGEAPVRTGGGCRHLNSPNQAPQGFSAPVPAVSPQCDDDGFVFNRQHLLGLSVLLREEGAGEGGRPSVTRAWPPPTWKPQPTCPNPVICFPHGLG